MSTDTVSPLRQRMNRGHERAQALCAGTQRGHIRGCKRFAAFSGGPETATAEDIRQFSCTWPRPA